MTRRVGAATAVLVLLLAPHSAAQELPLRTVVERATAYVSAFTSELSGIVAEEFYIQDVRWPSGVQVRGQATHRELRSDLLLLRPVDTDRFVEFRDVFEVDGAPVRDRQERLTQLFSDETAPSGRFHSIVTESARHNIGRVERNVNTPTLALLVLHPNYQRRFRFSRAENRDAGLAILENAPPESRGVFRASTEATVIEFREIARGTVIRTQDGKDVPVRGRLWIERDTGRVLLTELIADNADVRATIDVSYGTQQIDGFLMPAEMRERYESRSVTITGIAAYSNFRRFSARADITSTTLPR